MVNHCEAFHVHLSDQELGVLIEALWELARELRHEKPARVDEVWKLRRYLVSESVKRATLDSFAAAWPALPPEST